MRKPFDNHSLVGNRTIIIYFYGMSYAVVQFYLQFVVT